MDKYVSVNKIKAKVISGEPVLFSEATQHEIFFLLELEPSEDVEPVTHAHWVPCEDEYEDEYKCSACGGTQFFAMTPQNEGWEYCPECGAKMDEEKNEVTK